MVFVCGCAPLTFEQKREYGWLSVEEGRRCTVEEHPEWENTIKEEVLRGNIVKGMTLEQVEAATGQYSRLVNGYREHVNNGERLTLLHTDSSGYSTYRMSARAASVEGRTINYIENFYDEYYLYFYQGRLEYWSYAPYR